MSGKLPQTGAPSVTRQRGVSLLEVDENLEQFLPQQNQRSDL
jgi:hypothetical protein